jgi:hypothetical protein
MAVHIHEFLYRGRPEGSAEPPGWHLTLVSLGENDFGEPARSERTLNMAEAKAAGWGLPEVIAAINADVLADLERTRADMVVLREELERAKDEKAQT